MQRPGLLQRIALDIFILRNLAKVLRKARNVNSNLPALIDDWASSIYKEMSYINELRNAEEFANLFSHYPEVCSPPCVDCAAPSTDCATEALIHCPASILVSFTW